jgi:hypothetical protein
MKWKQRFDELGLTNETISQGLKNKIRDYYDIQQGIADMKQVLANPSVNDNVEEIQADLEDAIETLEAYDNKLVGDVELYFKNKDTYADKMKKMAEGREKKKQAMASGGATKTTTTTPQATQTQQQPKQVETKTEGEEKKSNWGWIGFAVLAGVVTLGAVNLFKDRD